MSYILYYNIYLIINKFLEVTYLVTKRKRLIKKVSLELNPPHSYLSLSHNCFFRISVYFKGKKADVRQ